MMIRPEIQPNELVYVVLDEMHLAAPGALRVVVLPVSVVVVRQGDGMSGGSGRLDSWSGLD